MTPEPEKEHTGDKNFVKLSERDLRRENIILKHELARVNELRRFMEMERLRDTLKETRSKEIEGLNKMEEEEVLQHD